MSQRSIVLVGAGGHARACIEVVANLAAYRIAGLIGVAAELETNVFGYPVIGTDGDLEGLAKTYRHALVTIGQIKSPQPRKNIYETLVALRWDLPTIVAPTAHVSRFATVGPGTIVMHGAIVNAGARVGANCIVNSQALIEHDVVVEDHCHISTAAVLNGAVSVGEGSFVGSRCVVREGTSIGRACVVGMGLSVRKDIADGEHTRGGPSS